MSWSVNIEGKTIKWDNLMDLTHEDMKGEWQQDILQFLQDWFDDNESIQIKTSGSTAEPKVMNFSKEMMRASAQRSLDFFGLKPNAQALLCLPAKYIAGKMMLVRSMLGSLSLDCVEPSFSPFENTSKDYDLLAMTPMQVERTLMHTAEKLKRSKNLIIGGAALNGSLSMQLVKLGVKAYESFGMTETCSHVALRPVKDAYFKALDGVYFSRDNNNCLVINDACLGISNLLTNDLVELKSSTQFKFLGRNDWVVNSGGVKLHPEHIEKRIAHLVNRNFFLIGKPDESLGEALVLIYEGKKLREEDELRVKQVLSKFEKPKEFIRVKQLQRLENGKLNRKASAYFSLEL